MCGLQTYNIFVHIRIFNAFLGIGEDVVNLVLANMRLFGLTRIKYVDNSIKIGVKFDGRLIIS